MHLTQSVLADASAWCRTSSSRDIKTITTRFENEGLSFLTITLPSFCSEFERALAEGFCDHTFFPGFRKRGGTPQFLGGFLDLVFDRRSGVLIDEPDEVAIFYIRQITLLHKKIRLECSDERSDGAFERYVNVENEVVQFTSAYTDEALDSFARAARKLYSGIGVFADNLIYRHEHLPKHGPGATADKLIGNNKFKLKTWHSRLEWNFPSDLFVIPNSWYYDRLDRVNFVEPDAELPVKVISVPKTLKTPRIIAIEPTCMQYAQQSIAEILVSSIERDDNLSISIGFTDQTVNQRLARLASENGSLATIDLSDASDRVSNRLVEELFKPYPHLASAVQSCRSLQADVPGHGVMPLTKFASMGSALCFPVEAMVFLTIIVVAYEHKLGHTLTKSEVKLLLRKVRVYGDDIIVPVDIVHEVMRELEAYGLRVNSRKSFWTGKFRESCGKDYYAGHDVSVTYVRRSLPSSLQDVQEMISTVALRNHFYKSGLWNATRYLDNIIRKICHFPNVAETSPILGRFSYLGYENQRTCKHLHRPLVKGMKVITSWRNNRLSDYGALMKFFLKRGSNPTYDAKHLERSGRPESVGIKVRWDSAF